MNNKDEKVKDKPEINISTIKLMLENIKLYHDNEKLIIENSRLKNRLKELEVLHIGNIEKHMVKESVDYTAILIVKNGFKN